MVRRARISQRFNAEAEKRHAGSSAAVLLVTQHVSGSSGCRISTASGDRIAVEDGVRLAYHAACLPTPRIVWCDSPVELAMAWARAVGQPSVGANVKHILFDRPYRERHRYIVTPDRSKSMPPGRRTPPIRDRAHVVSAAVESAAIESVGDTRPSLLQWITSSKRRFRAGRRPTFAASCCGPYALYCASRAARARWAVHGDAHLALRALGQIAERVEWFVPHEGVCWLGERPDTLSTDRQGRLHCVSGPALRYRDGFTLFAYKGAAVPSWIIAHPERISLRWIDAEIDPTVRHAMIDILTPKRFVEAGGADVVATDGIGTLWRRKWTYRGTAIDAWAAVEYTTPTMPGLRIFKTVPTELRTPLDALERLYNEMRSSL